VWHANYPGIALLSPNLNPNIVRLREIPGTGSQAVWQSLYERDLNMRWRIAKEARSVVTYDPAFLFSAENIAWSQINSVGLSITISYSTSASRIISWVVLIFPMPTDR